MSDPPAQLIALGSRLVFEQSEALIALTDAHGRLIEVNPSLRRFLAQQPEIQNIGMLMEPHSRARFHTHLLRAVAEQYVGPITLNLSDSLTATLRSYRCHMAATADAQIVFLAEPIAALDQHGAEQYMQVVSDLSTTTHTLQKLNHALGEKQRALEDALAKIEHIARIDDLTQLLNRRSIVDKLDEEIWRAQRYQGAVSVLMIDIDHFKTVNDRYGHTVGDQVLRGCADLMRGSIRATDYLGRYGGEEFLCVLPTTNESSAADLAERLRSHIEGTSFVAAETVTFSVTISIGVAELDARRDTPELLIAHADNALYRAKADGRNRLVCWRS
ncbi:GGDEF domain-containing protein [Candidatus Chloroploca sp. Khr17]|uniref:GGDEF domain-containing protein n=1 Tax=Candidatus Chloroploca sp. Khr17 TaxID=2496869 RepID=UPI0013EB1B57|nr:GGDEF domain-containing protein [Candidatus Chloroploca sp. Khr17]